MGEARREITERDRAAAEAARPGIAAQVLAYFQRNARAMDSVEGIARFWVHAERDVVESCLEDLHARGFLERRLIAGTPFYSLQRHGEDGSMPAPAGARSEGAAISAAIASSAARVEEAAAIRVPAGRAAAQGAVPAGPAAARVLVVDDDPPVRRFLIAALQEAGYAVEEADDGETAIRMFRARPYDLVVTDIMMPGTSGIEVLRSVKQFSPWTEVIVVTAYASLDTALRALRDGAYDLLTKPLPDLETLQRAAARALERRRLSSENRFLVENLQARNVELTDTVARLAAVNEIARATTGLLDMDELYNNLVRLIAQHLKARRVSVLISEPDSDTMRLVASVGIPEQETHGASVRIGEGIAGRVAATETPLLVADIEKSDLKGLRTGGRYATSSFMSTPLMVSYPIRYQQRRVGVINVSDKHSGQPFTEQDLEFLSTLAYQVAVAIENARLVREMENGYMGALVALIRAVEDARPETRGHSTRVAELAGTLAETLGLAQGRIDLLVRAAALHEVGRLAGRASHGGRPADFWNAAAVMAAERLLAPIASLKGAREIILHSADWFDATPMPFGGDTPSTPIEARILAVCEDFVRLTPGGTPDRDAALQAAEAIRKDAGRRHDPKVVATLLRLAQEGGLP
ncbi:MAG: response regulator, partial [Candidatus Polarisedimenticolia bacterium]